MAKIWKKQLGWEGHIIRMLSEEVIKIIEEMDRKSKRLGYNKQRNWMKKIIRLERETEEGGKTEQMKASISKSDAEKGIKNREEEEDWQIQFDSCKMDACF